MRSIAEKDAYAREILRERMKQNTDKIKSFLEKEPERMAKGLLLALDDLFHQCVQMQNKKEKGKIAFIHFFFLKTAVLTGTYEIQINLFDKRSYFDSEECYRFWIPEFFVQCFQEDMEFFKEKAEKDMIQFGYPDFMEIKMKYCDLYFLFVGQYLLKAVNRVIALPSYGQLEKEEDLIMIYGGYQDKGIQVYPPMEVTVCDTI